MSDILIKGMDMPENFTCCDLSHEDNWCPAKQDYVDRYSYDTCSLIPVPPHGSLKRRIVYRGEVYNALEAARINSLDGILTDPYKEGFHDGLKRAIQILANQVEDAPTIIPAEEGNEDICACGKCGKTSEIVCLVDDVPYCEACFLGALQAEDDVP